MVVTTAHERFAISAFEHEVVDYLLKPVEKKRLAKTLTKLGRDSAPQREKIVVFSDTNNCWPVSTAEILMVEASGSYVTLFLEDRKPITLTRSLKDLVELLGSGNFVRANRSQIVRLSALKSIKRLPGGSLSTQLDGIGTVEFSRRQSQSFRQRYGF